MGAKNRERKGRKENKRERERGREREREGGREGQRSAGQRLNVKDFNRKERADGRREAEY